MDVHPQGTRFATAAADNRVKVWNMLPVIDVHQETDKAAPKLLATLADHFSAVNVARFSRSGRFLASGASHQGTSHPARITTSTRNYSLQAGNAPPYSSGFR